MVHDGSSRFASVEVEKFISFIFPNHGPALLVGGLFSMHCIARGACVIDETSGGRRRVDEGYTNYANTD